MVKKHNDLSRYIQHPKHDILPGAYTDDTQMTIAIAEAMLSGEEWTPTNITLAAACFSKEISQDLPNNLYQCLERSEYGYNYLKSLEAQLLSLKL